MIDVETRFGQNGIPETNGQTLASIFSEALSVSENGDGAEANRKKAIMKMINAIDAQGLPLEDAAEVFVFGYFIAKGLGLRQYLQADLGDDALDQLPVRLDRFGVLQLLEDDSNLQRLSYIWDKVEQTRSNPKPF